MRLSYRLIVWLIVGITGISFLFARRQVTAEKRGLRSDLERRAAVLAESLEQAVEVILDNRASAKTLPRLVEQFGNRERLAGIAVYSDRRKPLAVTSSLADDLSHPSQCAEQAIAQNKICQAYLKSGDKTLFVYAVPLHRGTGVVGGLAVFHDASYIEAQSWRIWRETFLRVLAQVAFIVLFSLLIVRWTIGRPIAKTAQWMRELRTGKEGYAEPPPELPQEALLQPLAHEVTHLARSLHAARAAAEEEARLREAGESLWTAEKLRIYVGSKMREGSLFVVSNREPYMHIRQGKSIEAVVPASGLVTALEPILRACQGTWVAHGGGDADRETVDERDHLRVPPGDPQYTLRRVWLTKEMEEGYYFGFANEGLWPLCHIAHTRPIFRVADWEQYQHANQKFADALLEEMEGVEEPSVLVQDYHFALLPRLVKERRPDARVAIFWHIPWPNAQAFGICPWQRELVDGLLGADLIGFHIQSHCRNFLESVDNAVESRIEWERLAVNRGGHLTVVKPIPISVAFTGNSHDAASSGLSPQERAALLKQLGVETAYVGIGVDRVDYTKGILERFQGVERFLEKFPRYRGQFTFVQIGAPSRTHIKRYSDLLAEVEAEAERINWRFKEGKWKPIVLFKRHHSHTEIETYYRAADVCLVTSLHDGMNLVAKEFVAARDDEGGALILSQFAGASGELRDALPVNPYDIEQIADTIRYALEMDPEDRTARMQRLREVIKEHNIYHWAGDLIAELSEIRLDASESVVARSRAAASLSW
jgi:trehalose-6-phosphate synthase